MKLGVTFDFPDASAAVAVMLEERIHDMVKVLNQDAPAANVSVYRVRLLTDKRFREAMDKLYARRGLVRRLRAAQ